MTTFIKAWRSRTGSAMTRGSVSIRVTKRMPRDSASGRRRSATCLIMVPRAAGSGSISDGPARRMNRSTMRSSRCSSPRMIPSRAVADSLVSLGSAARSSCNNCTWISKELRGLRISCAKRPSNRANKSRFSAAAVCAGSFGVTVSGGKPSTGQQLTNPLEASRAGRITKLHAGCG
ncbi:hypothetical protein SDC9_186763 [bioreactor metagenome]|uniref:Uncharacterized protein n=1 Tax=bioreactor metagenome TaxID=1076179 RepID=A0A645HJP6_9ZZZZ